MCYDKEVTSDDEDNMYHVNKSHKYEVEKMCYDKEVISDDEDNMCRGVGMFKKETTSNNLFAHVQPEERKAHWIKTDAECKYIYRF